MASARVFLLMLCVAMVFSRSTATKDLWTTLVSDQRFKFITKGFIDIGEVDALKARADGSSPFVFIGQTDESFLSELGPETMACITSPSEVKNNFAQILRFLQVPVTQAVKTGAELAALANKNGNRLSTVNGMPIFVESQPGEEIVVVSADEENMDLVATITEVIEISRNVSIVVLGNGIVMPTQLEEQILLQCGKMEENAEASLPVAGTEEEISLISMHPPKSDCGSKPRNGVSPCSKSAPKSTKGVAAPSSRSPNGGTRKLLRGGFW